MSSTDEWIKKLWYIYTMEHSVQFSSVAQSCPTFCNPMDCSLPGFSIHGISQAKVLEWGAIAFSSFHVLAIVNSAAVNNGVHVSSSILVSSGYMPRSGIAGSYGGFCGHVWV